MVDTPDPAAVAAEPSPQSAPAGVEAIYEVPPRPDEGGEWELLLAKLRAWWASGEPQDLWHRLRKPLGGGLTLVVVLLVLQVYGAVIDTLNSLPLLPGLLELAGLIWLLRQGLPRLLRSSDRQQLFSGLASRWQAFRGST